MENLDIDSILYEFERKRYKSEDEERILMKVYGLEFDLISGLSVAQEETYQKLKGKMFELKEIERRELIKFLVSKILGENRKKSKKNIDIKY